MDASSRIIATLDPTPFQRYLLHVNQDTPRRQPKLLKDNYHAFVTVLYVILAGWMAVAVTFSVVRALVLNVEPAPVQSTAETPAPESPSASSPTRSDAPRSRNDAR